MARSLRYRAVLFDLDGTLVDSYAALAEAVNYARREHGHGELAETEIRTFVGDGLEKLLQRAFRRHDVPATAVHAFERRYDEICCSESRVLDDVQVTLDRLHALGVTMAVCTNKPTPFSEKILAYLQLAQYFRAIVGPDVAGAHKPDAEHVLRTLRSTQCERDVALFVGDMPIDVRAARNSGIDVAVVPSGSSTAAELIAANPDHFLERFADLVPLVTRGAEV